MEVDGTASPHESLTFHAQKYHAFISFRWLLDPGKMYFCINESKTPWVRFSATVKKHLIITLSTPLFHIRFTRMEVRFPS